MLANILKKVEIFRRWRMIKRAIIKKQVDKLLMSQYADELGSLLIEIQGSNETALKDRNELLVASGGETPEQSRERTLRRKELDKKLNHFSGMAKQIVEKRNNRRTEMSNLQMEIDELVQRGKDIWNL